MYVALYARQAHTTRMELELEYTEAVGVPDKCRKCPILKEIAGDYARYSEMANGVIEALMGGNTEEFAIARLVMMGYEPDDARDFIAENAESLRQSGKTVLERADGNRDNCVDVGQRAVAACGGSLTMRARRDGNEVRVTVCMSPEIPSINAIAVMEPATIERTKLGDVE